MEKRKSAVSTGSKKNLRAQQTTKGEKWADSKKKTCKANEKRLIQQPTTSDKNKNNSLICKTFSA